MSAHDLFDQLAPEHFETVDRLELTREEVSGVSRWKLQAFSGGAPYFDPMYSLPGDVADLRRFCDLTRSLIIQQEVSRAQ